ncbi:MAG TPA: hypothetical protein VN260_07675, partial [Dissulfurispiraceae bacterium]|nr:hypothetical protein [Dissulfurispiraceae bacterium]
MAGEAFSAVIRAIEAFAEKAHRLGGYAQLWFSEDTRNQDALAFLGRVEQTLMEAQNRILFFSLWWKGIDDGPAERLEPYAGDGAYYLRQARLFRKHTLSEPEERVINLKDVNGINALVKIYDMVTNAFTFEIVDEGETKKLSRDGLMVYARHPSPDMREAAYRELYRVYGGEAPVLSQIYTHRVLDWMSENINLRHISSPIAVRNLSNDIPDAVTDTLLDVCIERAPVFHRFFRLKADMLGMAGGRLRRYDLYAPLRHRQDRTIPFRDAADLVLG